MVAIAGAIATTIVAIAVGSFAIGITNSIDSHSQQPKHC